MSEESAVVILLDRPLCMDQNPNINLFRSKLRTKPEKAFSMNFKIKEEFPLPTKSYTCTFKISYRFDCFLICIGQSIHILDRKSKKILKTLDLERPLITLTLDDDSNEIYLICEGDEYMLEKYELSSFLNGNMECVWSVAHDFGNPYRAVVFNMDKNRVVIVCEYSSRHALRVLSCENGKVVNVELPGDLKFCTAIQLGSRNELIVVYYQPKTGFIKMLGYENGKFISISQDIPVVDDGNFRGHSLLYDRVSDLIYFTDYLKGNIYVFRKQNLGHVTTTNCFHGTMLSAMCLDQLSGEFLVIKQGVLYVLE